MDLLAVFALFLLGVCMGSFAGASVWRLRADQLADDKKDGFEYDKKEFKKLSPLMKRRTGSDRSMCLKCNHQLAWYDLIPLFSWFSTGGKCRYCQAPIGKLEPLIELFVGLIFVISYIFWPFGLSAWADWAIFGLWLAAVVLMAILFTYDAKWQILPLKINLALILVAVAMLALRFWTGHDISWISLVGSMFLLGGLYALLYLISQDLVGDADRILGLAAGVLLADWRYAFLALFLANLLGTLFVLPGMIGGKLKSSSKVAFGPFMILAVIVAFLFGGGFVEWFMGFSLL